MLVLSKEDLRQPGNMFSNSDGYSSLMGLYRGHIAQNVPRF